MHRENSLTPLPYENEDEVDESHSECDSSLSSLSTSSSLSSLSSSEDNDPNLMSTNPQKRQKKKQLVKKGRAKKIKIEEEDEESDDEGEGYLMDLDDEPPSLEYKEGQRVKLLELPTLILEEIFSLQQDLSLSDHINISGCCWFPRKAYLDEENDKIWRSLWIYRGPGPKWIYDGHSLARKDNNSKVDIRLTHGTIYVNRSYFGVVEQENIDKLQKTSPEYNNNQHYPPIKISTHSTPNPPFLAPDSAMLRICKDYNNLGNGPGDEPKQNRKENESGESFKKRKKNWMEEDEFWVSELTRFQMSRAPLTRRELAEVGGDDGKLKLIGRGWKYGPWHAMCLREVNFPVVSASSASTEYKLHKKELSLIKKVPAGQVTGGRGANGFYFKRDILWSRDTYAIPRESRKNGKFCEACDYMHVASYVYCEAKKSQ